MRETEEGETCLHATTKPPSPWRKCKPRFGPQNYQMPFNILLDTRLRLPCWLSGKESTYQCRRHKFEPWVGKIPWRRAWQPTPVFMPGESRGQRSLAGYSPWGHKESDTTYWLNNKRHTLWFLQPERVLLCPPLCLAEPRSCWVSCQGLSGLVSAAPGVWARGPWGRVQGAPRSPLTAGDLQSGLPRLLSILSRKRNLRSTVIEMDSAWPARCGSAAPTGPPWWWCSQRGLCEVPLHAGVRPYMWTEECAFLRQALKGTLLGYWNYINSGHVLTWHIFTIWASLVAQWYRVHLPMTETWVWSLGWEDPLEKGTATHCSILAWRISIHREAWQATVHGISKTQTWLSD